MDVMVLRTGIFPDRETVGQALSRLEGEHELVYVDVSSPETGEPDWDRTLRQLLAADRIIVV
jgi:hypothetical protein